MKRHSVTTTSPTAGAHPVGATASARADADARTAATGAAATGTRTSVTPCAGA
ncbi:hypothetical protein PZB75_25210 [Streptomyces sp. AM 4-1-1]|uniref:hypothetical protein n=1 Tax=Streptomyces sp. AM 4-1-1 TaxID=3028710 RepID=UPI0023B9C290|nr:hypothetical protein [Streptomyces sp. AM 4-1-1]WEH36363.1 hypothetical protein PZB75_25210 [Streptomyces sp. AM 4-1-1]